MDPSVLAGLPILHALARVTATGAITRSINIAGIAHPIAGTFILELGSILPVADAFGLAMLEDPINGFGFLGTATTVIPGTNDDTHRIVSIGDLVGAPADRDFIFAVFRFQLTGSVPD